MKIRALFFLNAFVIVLGLGLFASMISTIEPGNTRDWGFTAALWGLAALIAYNITVAVSRAKKDWE